MEIIKIQLFRKQCFGDTEIKITAIINSFLNHSNNVIWIYIRYPSHAVYSKSHCVFLNIISGKLYLQHRNKIPHKQDLMVTPFLENVLIPLFAFCTVAYCVPEIIRKQR